MNLEKLKPWNWFKHENATQSEHKHLPVTRAEAGQLNPLSTPGSLLRLHREMDQLFDDVLSGFGISPVRSFWPGEQLSGNGTTAAYSPRIDVSGNDKHYEITLDVPGLSESDLSVEVKGDILVISGSKEEQSENQDKRYYRVERSYGAFQRTLSLPEDANADGIQASLKNGVLKLEIPRHENENVKNVKRISISSG